jgi:predicted GIY-YIG superfamily endonuclease
MAFFLYILRSVDYSYYVGHTDGLDHRMAQHHAGEIPGYTQKRRPVRLVFAQEFATRGEAIAAESQLKGWSRAKKEALILQNWERVRKLAKNRHKELKAGRARSPSTRPAVGSGRTGLDYP